MPARLLELPPLTSARATSPYLPSSYLPLPPLVDGDGGSRLYLLAPGLHGELELRARQLAGGLRANPNPNCYTKLTLTLALTLTLTLILTLALALALTPTLTLILTLALTLALSLSLTRTRALAWQAVSAEAKAIVASMLQASQ